MQFILTKKGQSSIEYAVMVVIVIAALIAMQNYFKRGVQGRWRTSVDGVGDQYDPSFTQGEIVQRLSGQTATNITTQTVTEGTRTLRDDTSSMTETKIGTMRVDAE